MRSWERTIFAIVGSIFLLLLVVLLGLIGKNAAQNIAASFPTPTGYEEELFAMRLRAPDLPDGYERLNVTTRVQVENGIGEQFIYYANQASPINMSQKTIIFTTPEDAKKALEHKIADNPRLTFTFESEARQHMPQADQVAWACDIAVTIAQADFAVRAQSCITIARYGNIYIELDGHIVENRLLTIDKFMNLLQILDNRVSGVLASNRGVQVTFHLTKAHDGISWAR
jgi:hypothetical protein